MSPITMVSYGPSQKIHPLSLLAQLTSRFASGCLQVSDGSTSWSIYLDQGKLAFATSTATPFERLDRHLRQFNRQVPALVSAVRVQVRLLFESETNGRTLSSTDYRAIRWLVGQEYLSLTQASLLIEELAKEVLEAFLAITEGNHEFVEKDKFEDYPQLCLLDLRPLVEHCQNQLRRRQSSAKLSATSSQKPTSLEAKTPLQVSQTDASLIRQEQSSKGGTPWSAKADDSKPKVPPERSLKGHYTIACIDDSPTILQAIKSFLDDASFTVIMINDPIKALMQVIRSKPDVILLDVGMPNLDGYELCSLLRRHANFKNTPIIMVTGNTGFIDRAKAKLVGASGYLTKPFTQSELLKMVFKHLS